MNHCTFCLTKYCMNMYLDSWQPLEPYWISTSRSHAIFCGFFCVPDAAATRGQYLALSKAWWSCFEISSSFLLTYCACRYVSAAVLSCWWKADIITSRLQSTSAQHFFTYNYMHLWSAINIQVVLTPTVLFCSIHKLSASLFVVPSRWAAYVLQRIC